MSTRSVLPGRVAAPRSWAAGPRRFSRPSVVTAAAPGSTAPTVIVTGGNTGIGFETAKSLASKGMEVTIACRDSGKADAAVSRIKEAVPSAVVDSMVLDLAHLSSVKDFSSRYLDSGRKLDILINNAGVMACPELQTKVQAHMSEPSLPPPCPPSGLLSLTSKHNRRLINAS